MNRILALPRVTRLAKRSDFSAVCSAHNRSWPYAADNVRMNNVLPGWIDSLPATEERRQSVPMQRYGTGEEIAATIAFLASDGAAYVTGQNLRVDGGITRSV
jgi:NAD(P)-dependent dehydrogenase (short-subunit alcohol dehydrogenase family)